MKRNKSMLSQSARLFVNIAALCLLVSVTAFAQTDGKAEPASATSSVATAVNSTASVAKVDDRYRIGPGDVLDIRVFNRPQLSREARVDSNGMIQMPLLEGDIRAACRTENELSKEIGRLYLKYQRNPYVNVFVKEYSSTPAAVIGEVEKPGQFQLKRRVRLLELLAFAGGPTDKAGGKIQIAHTGAISVCESDDDSSRAYDFYSLKDAMRGSKDSNPYVEPGDIVSIPEADQAFVVGNVTKPQAVLLKEPVTVSQAVAMAGGTLRASKLKGVRIVRPIAGSSNKQLIQVDLQAINKRNAPDILLEPNDVVEVPTDEGKIIRDKIFNAFTGGLSGLVYLIR